MIIYFKEKNFCDNSRQGYDGCFVDFQLSPFVADVKCGDEIFYAVKISDNYTTTEALNLASKAVKKSHEEKVTVLFALGSLVEYTLVE